MSKNFSVAAAFVLAVALPTTASAAGILFDGPGAAWKPANVPASGTGANGYWDQRSYDSFANSPSGACGAGTLVAGVPCDWAVGTPPPTTLTNPRSVTPGVPFEYFGLTNPAPGTSDAPLNFYFTGGFDFDWAVLFQLTAWDDTVEFGWYTAGDPRPEARHPIVGPGGPYSNNDGLIGTTGSTVIPTGDFGFYYRNTRYGAAVGNSAGDVLFFTQSRLNQLGSYFSYFTDLESGIWASPARLDDEGTFRVMYDDARNFQQFVAFRQGNRYWFGLEDQFGRISPQFCHEAQTQPCSDYDFNDFIINFVERESKCVGGQCPPPPPPPVPEPATLALLGGGVFAAAAVRRRRRQRR